MLYATPQRCGKSAMTPEGIATYDRALAAAPVVGDSWLAHTSADARPVPVTVADFEAEEHDQLAGPLPANAETGWARDSVWAYAGSTVRDDDTPGTAYEARYRFGDRHVLDVAYFVEESTAEGDPFPFSVGEQRTTFTEDEDGEQDDSTEETSCEFPEYTGHATLEAAMARARELALADESGDLCWDPTHANANNDDTSGDEDGNHLACDSCGGLVNDITAAELERVSEGWPFHCDSCTDPSVDYGTEDEDNDTCGQCGERLASTLSAAELAGGSFCIC
jgi:hypothetical protein